ncbi:hypothetical protein CEP54_014794 [Fusarium duplospermum]|uniref:Uncharacterized protein n=1 Tax=Fusarium duplospermum TaxID=1325734 RepID=A0A428NTT0_9HYPO|nr:hypothetical protein CEP54_014794 [Fusarium duplospermum]
MAPSKNNSRKAKAASKASSATPRVLRPRAVPAPASPSPAPDLSSGPLSASQSVESSSFKSFKTPRRSTIAVKTTDVSKISNSARVLRPRATPATASPSSAASQSSSPSATSPSTGPSSAESLKTRSRSATTVETPSKAVETEPSTTTRVLRSRATLVPVPVSDGRLSLRRTKRARVASPSPVLSPVLGRYGKRPRVDSGSEFEDEEEEEEDDDNDDDDDDLNEDEYPEDVQDAIVDADGLIRVGPQPMKPQRFIRSGPHRKVRQKLNNALFHCHRTTDRHLPGWSWGILGQERRILLASLMSSMDDQSSDNDTVSRFCDYSGRQMSWAPGPHSPSLESVYPFIISEGRIGYHASPNVHIISSAINWAKSNYAPILLPIIAVWMNAHEEPDFRVRKAQLSWAYNSATNASILCYIFSLTSNHANQAKIWSKWTPSKQRAVLEALRTGTKTPVVTEALKEHSVNDLFTPRFLSSRGSWRQRVSQRQGPIQDKKHAYPQMLQIARKYDLTPAEFEHYLTIKAPNRLDRVFYPFHVLSRSQAEAYGWDWWTTIEFCGSMVTNMKRKCNRHAEAAGYGEDLNGYICMFWMAHYFCNKIQALKKQRPGATDEEIRFSILDRWNLPLIPWVGNPFKASLCKGPDHGIAMKLGQTTASGEVFDPVNDIDLTKSTVELDTWFTNRAMRNFATADWEAIRKALAAIPLHHSFWRVDLALGDTIWKGH